MTTGKPHRHGEPRRSGAGRRAEADQGSVTLNLVAVFPAVLGLILLVLQAGLLAHAHNITRAAASEGLASARVYGATAADGRTRALGFLTETGNGLITDTQVTASRDTTLASVRVAGHALSLLPGFHPTVSSTATGPVEAFTPHP